ncbi:LytR/AlgR family response regulator transcription factor [Runella sp.]|uniref:LytR/AlgR family response regulator transcription factor n=1 Tax=Runella sp. TaxID=1960881 RepID=UPI003D0B32AA
MHFLIIEDDPIWQLKIPMMLEELPNVNLEIVETCQAAELVLAQSTPDIVLADISLPDGISLELFKKFKPDYPILFLTGFAQDEYLQQALAIPNTTFLVKPFHRLTLLGAIKNVLRTDPTSSLNSSPAPQREGIWVNGKYRQKILLPFKDIIYIEGEGNYVTIHTVDRHYVLKSSLRKILANLNNHFIQIQKKFILNKNFINRIDISAGKVNVKGNILSIGRAFQKDLLELVNKQYR